MLFSKFSPFGLEDLDSIPILILGINPMNKKLLNLFELVSLKTKNKMWIRYQIGPYFLEFYVYLISIFKKISIHLQFLLLISISAILI